MARNYIFAAKVNFEGSQNDGGTERKKRRRMEGRTDRGKEGRKEGRENGQSGKGSKENKGEEEEEEVRDGGRKQKNEGRQLLKAIALPPGCLRRAESVEMLNLA